MTIELDDKLGGILAMMPGFATDDATDIDATATVDVERLTAGLDRIIGDGIDLVAAGGSFGEGYALLPDELATLTDAAVQTANGRVPVFVGCLGQSAREILNKARTVVDAGAHGILLGLPSYFPLTAANAIGFVGDIATRFPNTAILLYHNPLLFRTRIPVEAFSEICTNPNIVGMKDSHREPRAFMDLARTVPEHFSVFVSARQWYPYCELGAAGAWSYEAWMGPAPMLRLRDAITRTDFVAAQELIRQIAPLDERPGPPDVTWRETASKIAVRYGGYCDPGPLRAPFTQIPPDVDQRARARAEYWRSLDARLRSEDQPTPPAPNPANRTDALKGSS